MQKWMGIRATGLGFNSNFNVLIKVYLSIVSTSFLFLVASLFLNIETFCETKPSAVRGSQKLSLLTTLLFCLIGHRWLGLLGANNSPPHVAPY